MQLGDRVREIVEAAGDAWVLKKRAEDLVWLQVFEGISDDDPPTKWLRARARHGDRAVTVIGIPFAWAHVKLAGLALWPIGKIIVPAEEGPLRYGDRGRG
jgi:hypothetical protein